MKDRAVVYLNGGAFKTLGRAVVPNEVSIGVLHRMAGAPKSNRLGLSTFLHEVIEQLQIMQTCGHGLISDIDIPSRDKVPSYLGAQVVDMKLITVPQIPGGPPARRLLAA